MEVIFSAHHYYLSVFLCVGIAFLFDLYVESWKFELKVRPPQLLRKIINREMDLSEKEEELEILFENVNRKRVERALSREDYIELKRIALVKKKNGGVIPPDPELPKKEESSKNVLRE